MRVRSCIILLKVGRASRGTLCRITVVGMAGRRKGYERFERKFFQMRIFSVGAEEIFPYSRNSTMKGGHIYAGLGMGKSCV